MPQNPAPLPDFTRWPSFPFEGDLRVKKLNPPVATEPPRSGEDAGDCIACNTPDDAYIWVSERWRVRAMDRPTGLPMVLILECRSHLDLGDLPNLLAAELGVMTVRLERAIRSLDGVARVHVNRWGDGSAHLHMWFLARPYGQLQLRGTFLSLWDDILPRIPEQQWRENLALVAAWLAEFGGRAIAEPPHIQWQSPATFAEPASASATQGDEASSPSATQGAGQSSASAAQGTEPATASAGRGTEPTFADAGQGAERLADGSAVGGGTTTSSGVPAARRPGDSVDLDRASVDDVTGVAADDAGTRAEEWGPGAGPREREAGTGTNRAEVSQGTGEDVPTNAGDAASDSGSRAAGDDGPGGYGRGGDEHGGDRHVGNGHAGEGRGVDGHAGDGHAGEGRGVDGHAGDASDRGGAAVRVPRQADGSALGPRVGDQGAAVVD